MPPAESNWLTPKLLENAWVALEPITAAHEPEIAAAADDPALFRYLGADLTQPEALSSWVRQACTATAEGTALVFVVRRKSDGAVVGSSRYMNIAPEHLRLEIGWTWYNQSCWGSIINPACKRLMIGHAFEAINANRVELKTDALNARSRAAIEKLGARAEGILHAHMVMPGGRVRDTALFAITADGWPEIHQGLDARLALAMDRTGAE